MDEFEGVDTMMLYCIGIIGFKSEISWKLCGAPLIDEWFKPLHHELVIFWAKDTPRIELSMAAD
jgi:hypothetical protein